MNQAIKKQINQLPQKPGVYIFLDKTGRFLYVGKAVKIKNRVRSHFVQGNQYYKKDWLPNIAKIDFIVTGNEKEALLLENELIKKYQPRFNIQWKDDKSYFWIEVGDEEWPRVRIVHKPSLSETARRGIRLIGPFVNGTELKQVLRALRKIIPYRTCKNSYEKPCLQWHLGLCPAHRSLGEGGPAHKTAGGQRTNLKKYCESLNALAQLLRLYAGEAIRIEAYDISNIQGTNATGSMVVFKNNRAQKSAYRKFKIKTVRGANDAAMLKEVLNRRACHQEWPLPDLILIDGGQPQLSGARNSLLAAAQPLIPIVSLAKQQEELYTIYSPRALRLNRLPVAFGLIFQAIRDEAHRFAISYYRKLHRKSIQKNN